MKVEKGATGSNNINAKFIETERITELILKDEGEMRKYTNEDKKTGENVTKEKAVFKIDYRGRRDNDPDTWVLNTKSLNALIDLFSDDTAKWVGRAIEVSATGEGEFRHIVVDTIRTKTD